MTDELLLLLLLTLMLRFHLWMMERMHQQQIPKMKKVYCKEKRHYSSGRRCFGNWYTAERRLSRQ
jgi:hypothetical protein